MYDIQIFLVPIYIVVGLKCTLHLFFRWLVGHLMGLGYPKALSDWIGTNLKKVGDHETWIFDLQNAKEMFDSYW